MKIALVIMTLVAAIAFSLRVGDGWYEHNDGVTISCSLEPISKLFHPGNMSVKGCSFDHQPLYPLLVKFTSGLSQYKLHFYQYLNVLFMLTGWLILALSLMQSVHWSLALSIPFFFLSSFNTLHWIQELRMYALFLGSSSILLADFLRAQKTPEVSRKSLVNHIIGYFNFLMYCLPFIAYLGFIRSKWGKWDSKLKALYITLLIFLVIKIPFVFWWRFQNRRGGIDLGWDHIKYVYFVDLFKGSELYITIAWITLLIALSWHLARAKTQISSRWYLGIILTSYVLVIGCSLLQMHEIELRYLLFLYPLFAIMAAEALDQIPLKAKFALSIIFVLVGFKNASLMGIRGVPDGGEIRLSSEAYTKYSKNLATWTDDPYFFFSYVGVYSYVNSGIRPEVHNILESQSFLPKDGFLFITVYRTEEEHKGLLKDIKGQKKMLWSTKNLLGSRTIMTEVMADRP